MARQNTVSQILLFFFVVKGLFYPKTYLLKSVTNFLAEEPPHCPSTLSLPLSFFRSRDISLTALDHSHGQLISEKGILDQN